MSQEKPLLPGFETAELVADECIRRAGLTFEAGVPLIHGKPVPTNAPWGSIPRTTINAMVSYHWHRVREMAEKPAPPDRKKPRFEYSLPPRAAVFKAIRERIHEMEKKSISGCIDKSTAEV